MGRAEQGLEAWTRDWKRLRQQKRNVEAAMFQDYLLYEGEAQSVRVQNAIAIKAFRHERDKNKLRLVIPLAKRLCDRKIGRHFSIAHEFVATPNTRDPIAIDRAELIGDQLIPALDYKLQQHSLRWQLYGWMAKCGVVFEHCDWKEGVTQEALPKYDETTNELLWFDTLTRSEIPESQLDLILQSGQVAAERFRPAVEVQSAGDVGGDVYDPFRVFVDASVGSIKNLGPDQAVYLADIRTFEWIEDTFGEDATRNLQPGQDLSILTTKIIDKGIPVSGLNLKDFLPLVQGSQGADDPDMALVLTRYSPPCAKYPEGQRCIFVPEQAILDAGDMPYPEVPLIDYHWSTPGDTIWTPGFMRDLQAMSKFVNKRFSQLGEASNAQLYEMMLLGGDLTKASIPTDFPGVVEGGLNDDGVALVQTVPRGNLPSFFTDSIKLSMETVESLGSSDLLSQRKFPTQLRGSLAIPILQEMLDSEDGPRYYHLAEQFAREKQMRINRVQAFYPPIRTLIYVGSDQRNEVVEFHTEEVLRAGVDYTVTVDPSSIFPEVSAMREARVRERLQWAPGLYTSSRTGTTDWSLVARDLKHNDKLGLSRANSSRKLARQLIQWVRQGKLVATQGQVPNPATGKPDMILVDENGVPFVVYPFWDHNVMMDQYQEEMQTTEFLQASPVYKRTLLTLYEAGRKILAAADQAKQNSIENRMVQGAMAQASQQAAAKAAAMAVEQAMEQVQIQQEQPNPGLGQMQEQIRQLLGEQMGNAGRPPVQVDSANPAALNLRRRLQAPGLR